VIDASVILNQFDYALQDDSQNEQYADNDKCKKCHYPASVLTTATVAGQKNTKKTDGRE
jgi:hypothetical protein